MFRMICRLTTPRRFASANSVEVTAEDGSKKIVSFDKAIVDAGFKAAQEVYAEHSAKDAFFKKVFEDFRAFQRDQVLWNRISELVFTTDMSTYRL